LPAGRERTGCEAPEDGLFRFSGGRDGSSRSPLQSQNVGTRPSRPLSETAEPGAPTRRGRGRKVRGRRRPSRNRWPGNENTARTVGPLRSGSPEPGAPARPAPFREDGVRHAHPGSASLEDPDRGSVSCRSPNSEAGAVGLGAGFGGFGAAFRGPSLTPLQSGIRSRDPDARIRQFRRAGTRFSCPPFRDPASPFAVRPAPLPSGGSPARASGAATRNQEDPKRGLEDRADGE